MRVPRGLRNDRVPRVVHVREVPARPLLTVHARDHRGARTVELVGRHQHRPEARGKVLAFRRTEPHLHLGPLEISSRPVVQDREAADLALGADDRRDLELVVELLGVRRVRDLLPLPVDSRRVGEIEDGNLVPLGRHLLAPERASSLHVLFEGVEVADSRWMQHRGAKVDVCKRILSVSTRRAAAGEIRLERLRSELQDGVALDDPRPAALELQILRSEHAKFHDTLVTLAFPCLAPVRLRGARIASANAPSRASLVTGSYPCLAPVRSGSPPRITVRCARSRRLCLDARGGCAPRSRWHAHGHRRVGSKDRGLASGTSVGLRQCERSAAPAAPRP